MPRPRPGILAVPVALAVILAGCASPWDDGAPGGGGVGGSTSPLTLILNAPTAGEVGDDLVFEAEVEGENPRRLFFFFWDFGNGARASDVNLTRVEHAYAAAGAYDVRLTVVDATGRKGEAPARVGIAHRAFFEGTVSRTDPVEVGAPEFEGRMGSTEGARVLKGQVDLTRPDGPVGLAMGSASAVAVRLLDPGGAPVHEAEVEVPTGGVLHAFEVDATAWPPGNATFRITAEQGIVHFRADLVLHYAPQPD